MDITEVKYREKLKLENKFKNIFLSSVSHNLKTPLNSNFLLLRRIGVIMNNKILLDKFSGIDKPT